MGDREKGSRLRRLSQPLCSDQAWHQPFNASLAISIAADRIRSHAGRTSRPRPRPSSPTCADPTDRPLPSEPAPAIPHHRRSSPHAPVMSSAPAAASPDAALFARFEAYDFDADEAFQVRPALPASISAHPAPAHPPSHSFPPRPSSHPCSTGSSSQARSHPSSGTPSSCAPSASTSAGSSLSCARRPSSSPADTLRGAPNRTVAPLPLETYKAHLSACSPPSSETPRTPYAPPARSPLPAPPADAAGPRAPKGFAELGALIAAGDVGALVGADIDDVTVHSAEVRGSFSQPSARVPRA